MTSVLFVLTVSVNALYSKVICLPSHTYLRILSRDTLKATHIRAVKALGRLGDKKARTTSEAKRSSRKSASIIGYKALLHERRPHHLRTFIENIQAALARLQAEP